MEKLQLIFNPVSAGGKTLLRKKQITGLLSEFFGKEFEIHETRFKGHAASITQCLAKRGYTKFASAGGDGTIQECINGLFSNGRIINPDCSFGIISCGTGQGFAKSFGIPADIRAQFQIIKKGEIKKTDLGKVKYGINGSAKELFFINEFQAGIGGSVVKSVQGKQKQMGGTLAYGLKTVSKVFTHPNQEVTICFDDRSLTAEVMGIVIANGAYTGGSMNLVPGADPCDNQLNLLIMFAQGLKGRLKSFSKIYSGTHLLSGNFASYLATSVSITSEEKVLMEADGELLGYLPCSIEIVPSAIKIYSDQE